VIKKLYTSTGPLYKVGSTNIAIAEAKKYSFFTAIAADRNIDRVTVFIAYIYDRDIVTTAKYIG